MYVMIFKGLFFSFLVSILSLVIVTYTPIELTQREPSNIYSPYLDEINVIQKKTEQGLHPSSPEWKRLDELIEKNNQWHEQDHNENFQNTTISLRVSWKKKSNYMSPVIMLLWV